MSLNFDEATAAAEAADKWPSGLDGTRLFSCYYEYWQPALSGHNIIYLEFGCPAVAVAAVRGREITRKRSKRSHTRNSGAVSFKSIDDEFREVQEVADKSLGGVSWMRILAENPKSLAKALRAYAETVKP